MANSDSYQEPTYYELLRVSPTAEIVEIKRAWRRQAKEYHSDRNPDSDRDNVIFRQLRYAFGILSDPTKRREYDEELARRRGAAEEEEDEPDWEEWEEQAPASQAAQPPPAPTVPPTTSSPGRPPPPPPPTPQPQPAATTPPPPPISPVVEATNAFIKWLGYDPGGFTDVTQSPTVITLKTVISNRDVWGYYDLKQKAIQVEVEVSPSTPGAKQHQGRHFLPVAKKDVIDHLPPKATLTPLPPPSPPPPGWQPWRVRHNAGFGGSGSLNIDSGIIYMSSAYGSVYALSAHTGQQFWNKRLRGYERGELSPPVIAGGMVYVTYDRLLFALSAGTGKALWAFIAGDVILSRPAIADNIVYVGSVDCYLHALDAATGEELWQFRTGGHVGSPAVVGGVVYVGSTDGNLHALDAASGGQRWRAGLDPYIGVSRPAVAGDIVCITGRSGSIDAVDILTGGRRWQVNFGGLVSSPATTADVVYINSGSSSSGGGSDYAGGGYVHALHAPTGERVWQAQRYGGFAVSDSPTIASGWIYVGCNSSVLAIDGATGKQVWASPTADRVESSPIVAEGVVYFTSNEYIYAINAVTGEGPNERIWV